MIDPTNLAHSYFLSLPPGNPTQGDIWSNLPLPYHDLPARYALLITPSCDFAHSKASLVNYLEIVPFREYADALAADALVEEELARARNSLRATLTNLPGSELLEIGVEVEAIASQILGSDECLQVAGPKKGDDIRQRLRRVSELTAYRELPPGVRTNRIVDFVGEKSIRQLRERIVRNQVSDLHFLPSLPTLNLDSSIVLLRSMSTCSWEFLNLAHKIQTDREWEQQRQSYSLHEFRVSSTRPERIARLRAPYLQSLMARVGALFARVGVPDLPDSIVAANVTAG